MKKFGLVLASLLAAGALVASVSASPGLKLDKQDIGDKQCKTDHAKQVVDVHYTLVNDYDSGFAGNQWANDTIDRHLRIWQQSDGSFCAQIEDHGKFVTFAGASPSGATTVPAGVKGDLEGGYITSNIAGAFAPSYATHGNLGTFDLQCNAAGICPGARPSWASYFSGSVTADEFSQWGWIYHAGKNGTWLNQDDVAPTGSGDITG